MRDAAPAHLPGLRERDAAQVARGRMVARLYPLRVRLRGEGERREARINTAAAQEGLRMQEEETEEAMTDLERAMKMLRYSATDNAVPLMMPPQAHALLAELSRLRKREALVEEWLAARNGDNDPQAPPASALEAALRGEADE